MGSAFGSSDGEWVPGGDFESGLGAWTQAGSDFLSVPSPAGGEGTWAVGCDLDPGQEASLSRRVPITAGEFVTNAPAPGIPGVQVEFGGWVWLEAGAGGGQVWLELESFDGNAWTRLAQSSAWNVDTTAKSQWLFLMSEPDALLNSRVPAGAIELRYSLHTSASGLVVFDAVRVRHQEREELPLWNPSFELWQPGQGAWEVDGGTAAGPTPASPTGYLGRGHARMTGVPLSRLAQTVDLEAMVGQFPVLSAGSLVEAGAWMRFAEDSFLPVFSSPLTRVDLLIFASVAGSTQQRQVAQGTWNPVASQLEHWVYLSTNQAVPLLPGETHLRLEISRSISAELAIDFVQMGELHGVDGFPRKRVGCNYVGRFRSPDFPSTVAPTEAQGRWRNWFWETPPLCSSIYEEFFHSPDCATSSSCRRPNGRRDLASSVESGWDHLPLAGAYDSRDPEIVRYHVQLAASAGIDHFIFDYQGHAIALQETAQGREPINEITWQALRQECNRPGVDLKLAVMYEPKVHFQGWVQGEPSKAAKVAGITADLVHLASSMAGERCALRRDNRLVVFIFRNKICNGAGTQCMQEADWVQVQQAVEYQTGERMFLVGDTKPDPGSALQGF
ncbi:MAG: hypothetical protein ACI9F9_000833, partial [Candidatus Paceibacteria bacterium]